MTPLLAIDGLFALLAAPLYVGAQLAIGIAIIGAAFAGGLTIIGIIAFCLDPRPVIVAFRCDGVLRAVFGLPLGLIGVALLVLGLIVGLAP